MKLLTTIRECGAYSNKHVMEIVKIILHCVLNLLDAGVRGFDAPQGEISVARLVRRCNGFDEVEQWVCLLSLTP